MQIVVEVGTVLAAFVMVDRERGMMVLVVINPEHYRYQDRNLFLLLRTNGWAKLGE